MKLGMDKPHFYKSMNVRVNNVIVPMWNLTFGNRTYVAKTVRECINSAYTSDHSIRQFWNRPVIRSSV